MVTLTDPILDLWTPFTFDTTQQDKTEHFFNDIYRLMWQYL